MTCFPLLEALQIRPDSLLSPARLWPALTSCAPAALGSRARGSGQRPQWEIPPLNSHASSRPRHQIRDALPMQGGKTRPAQGSDSWVQRKGSSHPRGHPESAALRPRQQASD